MGSGERRLEQPPDGALLPHVRSVRLGAEHWEDALDALDLMNWASHLRVLNLLPTSADRSFRDKDDVGHFESFRSCRDIYLGRTL